MIASMTGYGKSTFVNEKIKLNVEIKSVNSKQLDFTLRIPPVFREMETTLRNRLSPELERGKVEITIWYENLKGETPVRFNTLVLQEYKNQIDALVRDLDLEEPSEILPLLMRLPDVYISQASEADEDDKNALTEVVLEAVANFKDSRYSEGKGLYEFFFKKLENIRAYLNMTEKFENERVSKIREKLELQLSRLQGVEIDMGRLEQELIFYIEKLDVTEEKQRLRSHLNYFEETLGSPDESEVGGKGKKLGFISQEIGREINTLGSKSNDADMQKLVVMMKDELEQIKEQVLNVL